MAKIVEEPKAGVPAFMATFADLTTLLLVFFILLNVYARERQAGLITSMSGSFAAALQSTYGLGGLMSGSMYMEEHEGARQKYLHHDKEPGPAATSERTGDEVELGTSSAEKLDATEQVDLGAPFTFAHASDALPRAGAVFLDGLARDVARGEFVIELRASASFRESMMPMELAARRIEAVVRYLRAVGVVAVVEPRATVSDYRGEVVHGREASYRGVSIKLTRKR